MYDESLRRKTEKRILQVQTKQSRIVSRRRESIYGEIHSANVAKLQNAALGTTARKVIFLFNFLVASLLIVIMVFQLAQYKENDKICAEQLGTLFWERGCRVKVPYCHSLFTPTCNCAVIDKGLQSHNLPEKVTELVLCVSLRL